MPLSSAAGSHPLLSLTASSWWSLIVQGQLPQMPYLKSQQVSSALRIVNLCGVLCADETVAPTPAEQHALWHVTSIPQNNKAYLNSQEDPFFTHFWPNAALGICNLGFALIKPSPQHHLDEYLPLPYRVPAIKAPCTLGWSGFEAQGLLAETDSCLIKQDSYLFGAFRLH